MKEVRFIIYSELINNDNFMILKNYEIIKPKAKVCYIH